jgi:hypothetical protein
VVNQPGKGTRGGGSPSRWVDVEAVAAARWWHSSMVSGRGGGGVVVKWVSELLRDLLQLGVEGGGVEEVGRWLSMVTWSAR